MKIYSLNNENWVQESCGGPIVNPAKTARITASFGEGKDNVKWHIEISTKFGWLNPEPYGCDKTIDAALDSLKKYIKL